MQDMGKMPPGLKRRGNVFEVRRRVPDQIRAEIGKTEITKSLGTGDVKIALELFAAKNAEIEELFANARRKVSKALPEDLTKESGQGNKIVSCNELHQSADCPGPSCSGIFFRDI